MKNIFKGVSIILIVIAAIYQIVVFYQGDLPSDSVLNGYFIVAYIAMGISVVFALLFPVLQIISNPKAAVRSLIGVAFLVVLWFVSYALAGNKFTPIELENMKSTANISVLVGAGLIYTYFIAGIAIVAIIYASISNIFK